MNVDEIISENLIFLDVDVTSKKEALLKIATIAYDNDRVESVESYYEGLLERESLDTTGFGGGFAIPHAKISAVKKTSIIITRFAHPVEWEALDGAPVNIALGLAVCDSDGPNGHLKILSTLARALMRKEFTDKLMNSTTKSELINSIKEVFLDN